MVRTFYQGVLYFQIVTRLQGTRECNFIYASKNSTAFPASVCDRTVSVENADSKTAAVPLCRARLALLYAAAGSEARHCYIELACRSVNIGSVGSNLVTSISEA